MSTTTSSPTQSLVRVTKTLPVFPKTSYPPNILRLTNLDRQCPLPMYLVFFYRPSGDSPATVFGRLKAGLEETLSAWYPAAGRLTVAGDGKVDLWCNNGGAVMVEAVTAVELSELGDLSQYSEFLEELVYKPPGGLSDMPLVVAQVTRFGCGGYAIGTGISHSLFDGPSTHDFMRAWVANSARSDHPHVAHKPVHDRGSLLAINKLVIPNPRPTTAVDHLYQLIKQAMTYHQINGKQGKDMSLVPARSDDLVLKTFHVSGVMIDNLKRRIVGSSFECSSFELLAAHLWKARTKAQGVNKERLVCFQFAMDTRTKTTPPLPEGFAGNAYVLASAALSAGDLAAATHQSVVLAIRQAKASVTAAYVAAYIASLDGPPAAALPPLPELTLVSDWTRTPFHALAFVSPAVPAACVTPLATPAPEAAYFMRPPGDRRGIDIRIGLREGVVDAFSQHFLREMM